MLVHSFSQSDEWFDDYNGFLALLDLIGKVDTITQPKNINGIDLYFSWIRGDKKSWICPKNLDRFHKVKQLSLHQQRVTSQFLAKKESKSD